MEHSLPLKVVGEHPDRPVDRVIEKLMTENAQLRGLVIELTRIVVRNAIERK